MVQKRRGIFRMWNMVLIITAFTMSQLGMFINRGGPVPSVHSFAESTMGWVFLAIMALTLFVSITIFVLKFDTLKSRGKLESLMSRESVFLIQNILFLLIAFITLWGTVFPIFSQTIDDNIMTIGQPFFNKVNGPLMLLLILLMGIGPLLPWRKSSITAVFRMLLYPSLFTVIVLVFVYVVGYRHIWAMLAFTACAIATGGILQEWVRGTISRRTKGELWLFPFIRLITSNRPRYGGYVVHISIIMLAIGITASSFYDVQKDVVMRPGEIETLGKYTFKYVDVTNKQYDDRLEETAEFEIWVNGKPLGFLYPYRAVYPEFRISATRGAIHSTVMEDFYIVPSSFEKDGQAVFRVLINPMVWWMWASGPVLIVGTLFSLSYGRKSRKIKITLPVKNRMHNDNSAGV
jgi:cytochrome c-type biogenesis protein CcmF